MCHRGVWKGGMCRRGVWDRAPTPVARTQPLHVQTGSRSDTTSAPETDDPPDPETTT